MQVASLVQHSTVIGVTLATTLACVSLHYEVLNRMHRVVAGIARRRRRMMTFIIVILIVHTIEIWLFALSYYLLTHHLELASFVGLSLEELSDYVYYSAMVYTTVGFGDITPSGAVRTLTQVEAVTGLVMITWSATFTFLEMQSSWRRLDGDDR